MDRSFCWLTPLQHSDLMKKCREGLNSQTQTGLTAKCSCQHRGKLQPCRHIGGVLYLRTRTAIQGLQAPAVKKKMAASDCSSDGSDAERGQNEQLLYSAFRSTNLYKILGVDSSSDANAIKKAYRKAALKYVRAHQCGHLNSTI